MPLRLTYALPTIQSLMNEVFKDVICKFALVIFDDILTDSRTWEEHLQHIDEILNIFKTTVICEEEEMPIWPRRSQLLKPFNHTARSANGL
jgi:hypothetical protein